jgi:hypothetical protein
MHSADCENGGRCRVQDPDEDREEDAGVADLRSSTDSTARGGGSGAGQASIPATTLGGGTTGACFT